MGQLVLGIAGAVVGNIIAPGIGGQIGFAIGSGIGAAVFRPKAQHNIGPMLTDLRVTGTEYGQMIPYTRGHPRITGQIWWASSKRAVPHTTVQNGGGKGGPPDSVSTTYTYEVDLLIGLTDNVIQGVSRVWSNGKLIYTALPISDDDSIAASVNSEVWGDFAVYDGTQTTPDPLYEAAVGTANALAYIGRSYVVITSLNLGSSGQIHNLSFELGGGSYVDDSNVLLQAEFDANDGTDTSMYANTPVQENGSFASGEYSSSLPDKLYWQTDEARENAGSAFCLECRVKSLGGTAIDSYAFLMLDAVDEIPPTRIVLRMYYPGGGQVIYLTTADDGLSANSTIALSSSFKHVAIQYPASYPGTAYVYVDGVVALSHTVTTGLKALAANRQYKVQIGPDNSSVGTGPFVHDWVRLKLGVVYTGTSTVSENFTPPTTLDDPVTLGAGDEYNLQVETVSEVVAALCERAGLTSAQYDVTGLNDISRSVRGMAISEISPTRATLEMLSAAYFFDCTVSDKVYFIARGGASQATFAHDELGVSLEMRGDEEPLEITVDNEPEIPAQLLLTYPCFDQDYQPDTQPSDRLVTSLDESPADVRLPIVMTPSEAKGVVDVMLLDQYIALCRTTVKVFGNENATLEPTDPVTVTDQDGNTIRMRIVKRVDNYPLMELELVRDDVSILTSQSIASSDYTASITVAAPSDTEFVILDIPILRDADDGPGFYVAAKGDTPWPGCAIMRSVDGFNFTIVETVTESAVIGDCVTTMADWTGAHIFDEHTVLRVSVGTGTLTSSTNDAIVNDDTINGFAVGAHGRWELGQFRDATLVSSSPNVYDLTGLLRGRRGTEWAAVRHQSTDKFVLLRMSGLRRVTLTNSQLGINLYYRAVTLGRAISTATDNINSCEGIALAPFSPFNFTATRDPVVDDITFVWQRRSRLDVRMIGTLGISVPLGEDSLAFEIEVLAPGSPTVVLRTIDAAEANITVVNSSAGIYSIAYTAAQQATDFGSPLPSSVRCIIYQLSDTVGRGQGYEVTITL